MGLDVLNELGLVEREIVQYLDVKDIMSRLCLVSTQYRYLYNNNSVWRILLARDYDEINPNDDCCHRYGYKTLLGIADFHLKVADSFKRAVEVNFHSFIGSDPKYKNLWLACEFLGRDEVCVKLDLFGVRPAKTIEKIIFEVNRGRPKSDDETYTVTLAELVKYKENVKRITH